MISANAADLEYTECLTAASIFITQVICAFQEVNSELSAKERMEEEVRELQNIPRIMHKVYFSASVSNSKCATSPIVLPPHLLLNIMINDVICASKLIGTHTSETCAATELTYSVMHVATVVSLIKTTT